MFALAQTLVYTTALDQYRRDTLRGVELPSCGRKTAMSTEKKPSLYSGCTSKPAYLTAVRMDHCSVDTLTWCFTCCHACSKKNRLSDPQRHHSPLQSKHPVLAYAAISVHDALIPGAVELQGRFDMMWRGLWAMQRSFGALRAEHSRAVRYHKRTAKRNERAELLSTSSNLWAQHNCCSGENIQRMGGEANSALTTDDQTNQPPNT